MPHLVTYSRTDQTETKGECLGLNGSRLEKRGQMFPQQTADRPKVRAEKCGSATHLRIWSSHHQVSLEQNAERLSAGERGFEGGCFGAAFRHDHDRGSRPQELLMMMAVDVPVFGGAVAEPAQNEAPGKKEIQQEQEQEKEKERKEQAKKKTPTRPLEEISGSQTRHRTLIQNQEAGDDGGKARWMLR